VLAAVLVMALPQGVAAAPVLSFENAPELDAPAAVLMDASTGIVMFDKNMHDRHYPASMTKVMTALLALESFHDDLDARVPFSYEAVFSIPRNSSHIAMSDNETLSVREALYALMLESANEVANALGEKISGDMESFALLMTARAIELGAVNTRFQNAHGLHHPGHFTTPYDMALIMREAVQYPLFREIIATEFAEIPPTERQPLPRPLLNTNRMVLSASIHYDPNVVGGKTGFTDEARHTLVSYGRLRNMGLVSVVMRQERSLTFIDTTALMAFGFENFENVQVFDRNSYTREIPALQNETTIRAVGERSLTLSLPVGASAHIDATDFDLPRYIEHAVVDGEQIGTVTIRYGDIELDTIRMFAETGSVFVPQVYTPQDLAENFAESRTWLGALSVAIQLLLVLFFAVGSLVLVIHFKTRRSRMRRYYRQSYRYK